MQQDEQTQLQEGDVVNLDDTYCAHPYAKHLPFLSWLFEPNGDMFIAAAVPCLKEDDESPATYGGAYLLICNNYDAPEVAPHTYVKRWRIELFFRTAKQELHKRP